MAEHVDQDEVRQHYADLARNYAARANTACIAAFRELADRMLPKSGPVLEIGSGSMPALADRPESIGCDMSEAMIRAASSTMPLACADALSLPFSDESFVGAVSINVAEHVADPGMLVREAARVLRPDGVLLVITPNGNVGWLLEIIEKLRLKLPEGPHRFLTTDELTDHMLQYFEMIDDDTFLAFPAGPAACVPLVDAIAPVRLFQYCAGRKAG